MSPSSNTGPEPDWEGFMDYLDGLPDMPPVQGATSLTEAYDKAMAAQEQVEAKADAEMAAQAAEVVE